MVVVVFLLLSVSFSLSLLLFLLPRSSSPSCWPAAEPLSAVVISSEDLSERCSENSERNGSINGHRPGSTGVRLARPGHDSALHPSLEQDLLTCGQCQATFPLADILLFIEHKRKRCNGPPCLTVGRGLDKPPSPSPGLALTPSPALGNLRSRRPVEVGVQATLAEEDDDRFLIPRGIFPKLEPLPGRPHTLTPPTPPHPPHPPHNLWLFVTAAQLLLQRFEPSFTEASVCGFKSSRKWMTQA